MDFRFFFPAILEQPFCPYSLKLLRAVFPYDLQHVNESKHLRVWHEGRRGAHCRTICYCFSVHLELPTLESTDLDPVRKIIDLCKPCETSLLRCSYPRNSKSRFQHFNSILSDSDCVIGQYFASRVKEILNCPVEKKMKKKGKNIFVEIVGCTRFEFLYR